MNEFVLCYADSIDNPDCDWVVAVKRSNPPWQAGRINLPGGMVNPGEDTLDAARRLLESETGLVPTVDGCEILGTMLGLEYTTTVVKCQFRGPYRVVTKSPDFVVVTSLSEILCRGSNILPELRTIIPLCISRQPWQMIISNDRNYFNYVLQVNDF